MSNTVICLHKDCSTVNSLDSKFCEKCGEKVLLKDRYQVIQLIGQGGFGRTFLARDLDKPSQPFCVIKQFFPTAQGTDNMEKASKLFAQEAVRLEHLGKHPQIPELFAYFVTEDQQEYLVQEYIAGENLEDELKSQGVFDENKLKDFLIDVLKVLQFVHKNQVIHRDIKPENIIRRNSDQRLVLVDFGASKLVASPTALNVTGTVIGSAQYWAPEQSRGKPVFASDLYSLGVTCIHLLTNVDPFQLFDIHENDWAWWDHLKDNPVSDQLAEVLDKLITVGLKKRFQSIDEVLEALNYNQPDEPEIQAEPLTYIQFPPIKPISEPKIEKIKFSSIIIIKQGEQWITNQSQYSCILTTFNLGNEVNLEMVSIPGGSFIMGSDECDEEKPRHGVTIQPFLMGKYPITQAQYQIIMGENLSKSKGENIPVYPVSWLMAQDFCEKLSKQVGKKFYLPSESQWEYACRAGTNTAFSFGDMITANLANYQSSYSYREGPKGLARGKIMDVGSFSPNRFGLYDMHGNIWEWCQDGWHENYLAAPNDGSAWVKAPINDAEKVMRGGSYDSNPNACRSSFRGRASHSWSATTNYSFRVCCDVDLPKQT
jgi:formylglycine-generating enzyme required for sulfatase activity